ncbi:MAG: iron-containing alcohol dehydrogenase [Acutalibacteraceae bacterium]
MSIDIKSTPRFFSGKNCVSENGNVFSQFGKKCLIVTSKNGAERSGALGDVKYVLKAQNIEYKIFNEICENPLVSSCIKGGKIARDFSADFIIGIGGGSPLDASKAVAICAANPEYDMNGLYNRTVPSKTLPLVLIGTTSGTGSEITGVSVLTKDDDLTKKSISGADCYAAVSFLDPKYTYSMSYNTTVTTALDAFAHAVEGFLSPKCDVYADTFSKKALPLIYNGLKYLNSKKDIPTEDIRNDLYYGSIYAGFELNICGAAFPHTVGYILTENFGVPHGKACTAFMPYLFRKAKANIPERFNELLCVLNDTEENVLKTVTELTDVKIEASSEQIKKWCSRWGEVKNFNNTPGGFTNEEAVEAFKELL